MRVVSLLTMKQGGQRHRLPMAMHPQAVPLS
jgi:hypothetical protein